MLCLCKPCRSRLAVSFALFVIKHVNLYQPPGWSYMIGWKLRKGRGILIYWAMKRIKRSQDEKITWSECVHLSCKQDANWVSVPHERPLAYIIASCTRFYVRQWSELCGREYDQGKVTYNDIYFQQKSLWPIISSFFFPEVVTGRWQDWGGLAYTASHKI